MRKRYTWTPEGLAARRRVNKNPAVRARKSAAMKRAMADPAVRARHAAAMADPEVRARKSAAMKRAWANPAVRARHAAAMADPEVRARRGQAVKEAALAWCPQPFRQLYSDLRHKVGARYARQLVEKDIARAARAARPQPSSAGNAA